MTWESITFRTALLCSLLGMCTREVLAVPNLFIDDTLPQKFMFFLSSLLGFVCSVLVVPIYQCVYFQKYTSVYPVISGSCSPCLWAFVNELWLRDCIKRVDINMIEDKACIESEIEWSFPFSVLSHRNVLLLI